MDPNIFVKVWSLKLSNTTYVKTSMTSSCNEQKKKKKTLIHELITNCWKNLLSWENM